VNKRNLEFVAGMCAAGAIIGLAVWSGKHFRDWAPEPVVYALRGASILLVLAFVVILIEGGGTKR